MQLIKKLFGRPAGPVTGPESTQFHESEPSTETGSRNAPRRELVQVVLRDCMRRHGIPSAWMDCRILSVVTRNSKTGLHVQLIVRDGSEQMLSYVPAFQGSFMLEISRFDPRVDEWLFSLSWQFSALPSGSGTAIPTPPMWTVPAGANPVPEANALPATTPAGEAAAQAVGTAPAPLPAHARGAPADPGAALANSAGDEEVLEDLRALYAIRDAALRRGRPEQTGPAGERDFQETLPGPETGGSAPVPNHRR